jgi:hypothetical protein
MWDSEASLENAKQPSFGVWSIRSKWSRLQVSSCPRAHPRMCRRKVRFVTPSRARAARAGAASWHASGPTGR